MPSTLKPVGFLILRFPLGLECVPHYCMGVVSLLVLGKVLGKIAGVLPEAKPCVLVMNSTKLWREQWSCLLHARVIGSMEWSAETASLPEKGWNET